MDTQDDRNGQSVGVREHLLEQSLIAYVERYGLSDQAREALTWRPEEGTAPAGVPTVEFAVERER